MSIYTKTGDAGTTAVFGGKRLLKSDIQIETYGSIDELTSFIGLAIAKNSDKEEKNLLTDIQNSLYEIMGFLAGATIGPSTLENLSKSLPKKVQEFEKNIDEITASLPKLTRFVLPQGGELASWYHILRVVSRRVERIVVKYFSQESKNIEDVKPVIMYLNRLSDLFFTLARKNTEGKESVT